MVQNHSVGPPIWDSCDGRPDTQGWSYAINAHQFTRARPLRRNGCRERLPPTDHPGTSFNRLLAPCPRRAQTAGDSRPIAGSSGCPRPAQSSGPPRRIARIKLVPKLTVRARFPSENGTRAIARAISHLGECPWRLSVPKLTVRLQFPSPAPGERAVAAVVVVKSFCTALNLEATFYGSMARDRPSSSRFRSRRGSAWVH